VLRYTVSVIGHAIARPFGSQTHHVVNHPGIWRFVVTRSSIIQHPRPWPRTTWYYAVHLCQLESHNGLPDDHGHSPVSSGGDKLRTTDPRSAYFARVSLREFRVMRLIRYQSRTRGQRVEEAALQTATLPRCLWTS